MPDLFLTQLPAFSSLNSRPVPHSTPGLFLTQVFPLFFTQSPACSSQPSPSSSLSSWPFPHSTCPPLPHSTFPPCNLFLGAIDKKKTPMFWPQLLGPEQHTREKREGIESYWVMRAIMRAFFFGVAHSKMKKTWLQMRQTRAIREGVRGKETKNDRLRKGRNRAWLGRCPALGSFRFESKVIFRQGAMHVI